jgi:hypothetical protein
MNYQVLQKPLNFKKMKALLSILLLIMLPFCSNAACVTMGVTFGNPQSAGGICTGKGVCKTQDSYDFSIANSVSVTFIVNSTNPNVITMRFSMSDLMHKQPEQVSYFTDPNGYVFETAFSLGSSSFSSLSLPSGAKILSGIPYTTQVSGDLVSVYIPYSRD